MADSKDGKVGNEPRPLWTIASVPFEPFCGYPVIEISYGLYWVSRSCGREIRWRGAVRQRRVLCAERESAQGEGAGFHRRQIYRPRQVDGRLGDTASARAGVRLVRYPAGSARNHSRSGGGYKPLQRKFSRTLFD